MSADIYYMYYCCLARRMGRVYPNLAALFLILLCSDVILAQNLAPQFLTDGDLKGFRIRENTPVGDIVYTLRARDPEGLPVLYGIQADFLKVNAQTGSVSVIRKIDYESAPSFNVIIIASDGTSETRQDVNIQVIDTNDELPLFTRDIYKDSISENAAVGTTIIQDLSVRDRDTINRLIEVRCAPEKIVDIEALDTCEKFGLKTLQASNLNWQGVLVLKGTVDFESQRSYQVPIESYDGNPENNVTISVEITVEPVQDTPPKWVYAPSQSIRENVAIGFPVTKVSAVDGDEGNPREIRYEIYDSRFNYFTMDSVTGQISTRPSTCVLCEAREVLNGSVTPPLLGDNPQTTAVTTVRITVEDINDNPPTFDQSSYTVSIPEDIPTGTALPGLFMTVTDSDSLYLLEAGAGTSYTFLLRNNTREFEVFPGIGQGTTTASMKVRDTSLIDYEKGPREYRMKIIAQERGTQELFSSETTVTVRITDVNDNAPVFTNSSYTAFVREDAGENTFVIKVSATDLDTTPELGTPSIRYSLSGTESDKFRIDSITGDVTVGNCGNSYCLDYEQVKFYELIVIAKDEGGKGQDVPAKLRINILDVNDNQPVFLIGQYGSTILEYETLPDPPVNVQATDADENSVIRYIIINQDGTDENLFQINATSGSITARRPVRFSDTKPNTDEIKIKVRAFDGLKEAFADVTLTVIDLNDGPPSFLVQSYNASIPETTRGVVPVTSVSAVDVDSTTTGAGVITYFIDGGDQDKFQISGTTGAITTTPNATFDYDVQNEYRMLVKARDNGNPSETGTTTVVVYILDRNNRNPYFQPANLRAAVFENVEINFIVTTITGRDPDRYPELHYYFGEPKRAYSPTGGEVDRSVYNFTDLFIVEERTGIVRTNRNLSRDETSLVTYPIIVVDRNATTWQTGTGTLIIDIIDVNDKAPVFKPLWTVADPVYYQELEEEKAQGTFVRVLVATDPDGAIDRYEMVRNPGQFFDINPQTGEVTVNRRMDFDFDKGNPQPKIYNFTVRAYDNGLSPLYSDATVIVNLTNINDNTPRFSKGSYSVNIKESGSPDGSKPGDFVLSVLATDLDAGLFGDVHYGLRDTETRFQVDRDTGNITLRANDLDREMNSDITFQVLAYDGDPDDQRTASVQVYVTLEDINDNPPEFTQDVYEKTIPEIYGTGQTILQLSARDKDIKDQNNLVFEYANTSINAMFYIDPALGFVEPARSLQGRANTYEMPIVVKDNGGRNPYKMDTAVLRIVVQAVTNHPPIWVIPPRDNMTIFVLEEQYLGMIVYDVEAKDDDTGVNSIVDYSFETALGDNVTRTPEFRINPITGVIRAERVFDREERDRYTLVLVARDRGGLKNTIFLRIVIMDVNDHLPRFYPKVFSRSIPEDKKLGTPVITLTATDEDNLPNAKTVYYSIIAGNEDGMFSIGQKNGTIMLIKGLNAEVKSSYTLEILGYNNVSDYSVISKRSLPQNMATVHIQVTDINDNAPRFTQSTFFACVSSSAALDTNILQLTAEDADSQNVLTYTMSGTNQFIVQSSSGMITNKALLGKEAGKTYSFEVTVTDGATTDTAKVELFVTNADNEAMIVLAQPPEEVRGIKTELENQLAVLLSKKENDRDTKVCISRIESHIGSDASVNTAWSDVYFHGLYRTSNGIFVAIASSELATLTQAVVSDPTNAADLSIFYVRQVGVNPAAGEAVFVSTPTLVVMIILIILLVLAILLCICCCCCIRKKHRDDKDKLFGGGASHM
ncbi:cadherin-87A-like [Liolophura sinensis]|uniref:cadherin-87A-like n=1 Tax=Liolophura sinensis TaxID=3198878 RepID=UPI00315943FE